MNELLSDIVYNGYAIMLNTEGDKYEVNTVLIADDDNLPFFVKCYKKVKDAGYKLVKAELNNYGTLHFYMKK